MKFSLVRLITFVCKKQNVGLRSQVVVSASGAETGILATDEQTAYIKSLNEGSIRSRTTNMICVSLCSSKHLSFLIFHLE